MNSDQQLEKLTSLIKDFHVAMVTTLARDGSLHARPMSLAKVGPGADSWFVTSDDTGKYGELATDPRSLATFQSDRRYISVSGVVQLVEDRELLRELWNPLWKPWLPGGPEDERGCLLRLRARRAEFWNLTGTDGIEYWLEVGRAALTGRHPHGDGSHHGRFGPSELVT